MEDRVLNLRGIPDYLTPRTPLLIPRLTKLLDSAIEAKLSWTMLKMLGTAIPVSGVIGASHHIYRTFQISNERGRIAFYCRWNRTLGYPSNHLLAICKRAGRVKSCLKL
jgi:hypothetical protein